MPLFYLDCQFLSHPCYLTQNQMKSLEFNALVVKKITYLRPRVTLVFIAHDVKKGVSLCKLDDTEKNLMAALVVLASE